MTFDRRCVAVEQAADFFHLNFNIASSVGAYETRKAIKSAFNLFVHVRITTTPIHKIFTVDHRIGAD